MKSDKKREEEYIAFFKGTVALPDLMHCSLEVFAMRCKALILEEQAKPLPNNALIDVLCNAIRLGYENVMTPGLKSMSQNG